MPLNKKYIWTNCQVFRNGNGEITMKDKATGKTIYRTSFSSLFQEWVSEEEANRIKKGFENSFLLPYPKKEAIVTISLKDVYHKVNASLTHEIVPNDILIHQRGTTHITPHRKTAESAYRDKANGNLRL